MPTQHRAIQSRQALIRSAAQTFIEKGVPASGMVEISRRARLSKGALYFHFSSKEDLTLAVRDEALGTLRELEEALVRSPHPARTAIRDFAIALLGRVDADVVMRAGLQLRPETARDMDEAHLEQRWYTLFLDKAAADRNAGRLPPEADPRRIAQLVTSLVVGLLHLGHDDRTWWDKDVITDMWSLLLHAGAPPSEAAGSEAPGSGSDAAPVAGPGPGDARKGAVARTATGTGARTDTGTAVRTGSAAGTDTGGPAGGSGPAVRRAPAGAPRASAPKAPAPKASDISSTGSATGSATALLAPAVRAAAARTASVTARHGHRAADRSVTTDRS
ncbi:TetR/AcrR family transcriptional regulator [Streptomyces sp. MST-110588]|uniref:TetR/AcrR family transcriptional regulator n=1 Tax=Streptomyces sp. MST-110588 TaxID=2833628 RepID=UPI001F5D2253|nr:TetR/AcrR family transcriptional regulator [Streptomyces sp. MST-110588]